MGTKFRVVLYAPDEATADKAAKAAFARVAELNRIMSDYDPRQRIDAAVQKSEKPAGPVKVSDDLFDVLAEGQEVSRAVRRGVRRDGRPGRAALAAGPARTASCPTRRSCRGHDERVGYKKLELDPKAKTVKLKKPGMQLDLGGIAKGYAADEVLKVLAKHGITQRPGRGRAATSRCRRRAAGQATGWRSTSPRCPASKEQRQLCAGERGRVDVGRRGAVRRDRRACAYSHIVDPRTGLGLTGRRSVTVVARHGIRRTA